MEKKNHVKKHLNTHTKGGTQELVMKKSLTSVFMSVRGFGEVKVKTHSITEKGHIIRQEDDTMEWTIEINSLDELNAFADKYDKLVISSEAYNSKSPEIEIYDDYRE